MTRILITGANSFIARHLAPTLKAAGMETVGTPRHSDPIPGFDRIHICTLGDSLAPILTAERIDAVVHAALDTGSNAYAVNVSGTKRWMEEAAAAGIGLQILLSTLSATPDARSDYGRAKYDLEQLFLPAGGVVYRMGIVVGEGGMFGRMVESVQRYPVVPLLNGGRQLVYVLAIGFVCDVLRDCILTGGTGLRGCAWSIQQPQPYPLRRVIEAICQGYGLRRLLLPIPAQPVLAAVRLAERLPLPKLPISSSNVQGLIQQGQQIPSDFLKFGYPQQSLDELIAPVVSHQRRAVSETHDQAA